MKHSVSMTMLVTVIASALLQDASAQIAPTEWRAAEGGNGHWYTGTTILGDFWTLKAHCESHGGYLVSLTSVQELAWVAGTFAPRYAYVGAYQDLSAKDYSEPTGGWRWVSGEPFVHDPVIQGFDNAGGIQHFGWFNPCCLNVIDDIQLVNLSGVIEWSSDCNGDGVVDYGQILAGSLSDANGNGVPDCCDLGTPCSPIQPADCNGDGVWDILQIERGQLADFNSDGIPDCCTTKTPCVSGEYAVEWKQSRGGNGHWYVRSATPSIFEVARSAAVLSGGHLATLTSEAEWYFVGNINRGEWTLLGGFQPEGSCEPSCDWQWVTGEPWSYAPWTGGQPDDQGGEDVLIFYGYGSVWNDYPIGAYLRYWIEYDADCNNDGVVDFGQIRAGALPDVNLNNIPDGCECLADIFVDGQVNGADLGVVLSQWGLGAGVAGDINRDGIVNGADLTIVLGSWGPCGN